jgi:hypothetical protein
MNVKDLQAQWRYFGRRDFNRGIYSPPHENLEKPNFNPARLAYIDGWNRQERYCKNWIKSALTMQRQ